MTKIAETYNTSSSTSSIISLNILSGVHSSRADDLPHDMGFVWRQLAHRRREVVRVLGRAVFEEGQKVGLIIMLSISYPLRERSHHLPSYPCVTLDHS